MYLRRKIDQYLIDWKTNPDRKPLIIRGARQIGKTESVLHFARANYESIIEINFVRDEKYKNIRNIRRSESMKVIPSGHSDMYLAPSRVH